jgi:hypothetical protein
LENNVWETPNEFPTDMIKRCYEYRKINIAEFTTEKMRLLISKKIGIEYLIGIALEKLKRNILAEYWTENKKYQLYFNSIVEQNAGLIKAELGEKEFHRIQDVENRKHNNVYKT